MSPRVRTWGGEPSERDKSHPRNYDADRRPLSPKRPVVPQNTRPVRTFVRRAAWTLLVTFLVLGVLAAAVYVAARDKAEPTPPSNQPTSEAS